MILGWITHDPKLTQIYYGARVDWNPLADQMSDTDDDTGRGEAVPDFTCSFSQRVNRDTCDSGRMDNSQEQVRLCNHDQPCYAQPSDSN
jgi:hypothetical protein